MLQFDVRVKEVPSVGCPSRRPAQPLLQSGRTGLVEAEVERNFHDDSLPYHRD